jgi:hypothetical protein
MTKKSDDAECLEATEDMIGPHFQGLLYLLADYALQKKQAACPKCGSKMKRVGS